MSLDQEVRTSTREEDDSKFVGDIGNVGVTKSSHSQKILVVDDEQDIVFTLKTILTEAGFTVDAFTNPSVDIFFENFANRSGLRRLYR